ncbi:sulfurtransferase [Caldimonas brevitalea]|uniref:Sulfurtransferase n=1 Tax=Caldimonas brevitalea TaxID=413882 RepID=A0A0G3BFL1_9BURK|nr:sulfurtransferase [Caldimonas brevitalea]AKJ28107.1 3-mercaptopyruvate sulfurtransferase [Caldimonas brevitalea]
MSYTTLISAADLQALMRDGTPLVVLDVSFDLADTAAGEAAYASGHLPGAHYAHLDRDLSGPKSAPGEPARGRHPLPAREAFAATVGRWGIAPGTQVVVYDRQGGMFCVRAWWLLKWLGHEAVAVLDGGLVAWQAAGGALSTGLPAVDPQPPYPAASPAVRTLDAAALQARLDEPGWRLLDARAPERFRGDVEPLDPVAGHIPGAVNRFFKDNLAADGRFKAPAQLRSEFEALLAGTDPGTAVHQCGSGVTACHNLLAMEVAGLGRAALYPGSWSEWCADPQRPVARG